GWIHLFVARTDKVLLDTTNPNVADNKNLDKFVKKYLSHFPIVKLTIWARDYAGDAKFYEWNGRYFDTAKNKNRYDESLNENADHEGWMWPSGQFIPNINGAGHWDTLKRKGFASYGDAWKKGWIHVSIESSECILSSYLPMEKIEKRL